MDLEHGLLTADYEKYLMIKKDFFLLCFAGISFLALPIIAYPKVIVSSPTEFPALYRLQKAEAINILTPLEREELLKSTYAENKKATLVTVPFGIVVLKINEWLEKVWNNNSPTKNKLRLEELTVFLRDAEN